MGHFSNAEKIKKFSIQSCFLLSYFTGLFLLYVLNLLMLIGVLFF